MIVSDSSTLILLAKTNLLDIYFRSLKEKVTITEAVYKETVKKKQTEDAKIIENYIQKKEITVISIEDKKKAEKLQQDFAIGEGEAEAICLCLERKGMLITDDKKAIMLCKLFHIEFTTALNILVTLHKKGKISRQEAEALVDALKIKGRYSTTLIKQAKEDISHE